MPPDVLPLLEGIDIGKQVWEVSGLPILGAGYTIVGGRDLYIESMPNGKMQVEKQDFTGEIFFAKIIFNKDPEGSHSSLVFQAVFFHGELIGAILLKNDKIPVKEYSEASYRLAMKQVIDANRLTKWWFRYLYVPFCAGVWWMASMAVRGLVIVRNILVKISEAVTPW